MWSTRGRLTTLYITVTAEESNKSDKPYDIQSIKHFTLSYTAPSFHYESNRENINDSVLEDAQSLINDSAISYISDCACMLSNQEFRLFSRTGKEVCLGGKLTGRSRNRIPGSGP